MSLPAILAAASLAVATWGRNAPLDVHDFPGKHVSEGNSAAAILELLVDANGKVLRCETLARWGNDELAGRYCDLLRHKRLRPAIDANGHASVSVLREFIKMTIPGTPEGDRIQRLEMRPDLQIEVAKLRGVSESKLDFYVSVMVDVSGLITSCAASDEDVPKAYRQAACEQANGKDLGIASDMSGNAITSVRRLKIRFVEAAHSVKPIS